MVGFSKARPEQLVNELAKLEPALAIIEQMRGGSAQRFPFNQTKQFVDALIREVPFANYPVPDLRLFRGFTAQTGDLQNNVGRFSYRPVEINPSWGRCNRPDTTVFYGAMNLDTVVAELNPEIGQFIHIGQARSRNPITVSCIGEIDHVRRFGRALVGNDETTAQFSQLFALKGPEFRIRAQLIDAFFAEVFANKSYGAKEYKITTALAELVLEAPLYQGKKLVEAIAYPSVAHRGGLNVAVMPDVFDASFEWLAFKTYRVVDALGFGLYGLQLIASSDSIGSNGLINWAKREPQT